MTSLLQDLRYALRMLLRKPGFALIVVLTLALGIGANTAIFSLVNAVLLDALPFKDGERLVRLYDLSRRDNGEVNQVSVSQLNFFEVREQAESFDGMAAQIFLNLNLLLDEPERVVGIGVSDGWLSTLGVQPVLGRGFSPEEESAGSDSRAVLVSYGFWERRFGSSPEILGKTLTLDNEVYSVIGVMPRYFNYPYQADLWLLRTFDRSNGRAHPLNVQARLKPGVTIEQAQTEIETIAQRLAQQFPETNKGFGMRAVPARAVLVEEYDRMILILLIAVGFVLLIACANVANLLLARSISRRKEFAIRAALGSSRWRHIRQLLTENLLLSLMGGVAGVLLTFWIRDFLKALIPPTLSQLIGEVSIDKTVIGFTLLVSLLIGVCLALVSAFKGSREDLQTLLKEGGRSSGSPVGQRVLNLLVVGEIALAMVLLTGAGLMARNLYMLQEANLGFASEDLLSLKLPLSDSRYTEADQRRRLIQQVMEQIKAAPGVTSAAAANLVPLENGSLSARFVIEGQPVNPNERLVTNHRLVTASYFETMQIPILRGRAFTEQDNEDAPPVVIISQMMARRYWPNEDPVGRQVRSVSGSELSPPMTIIGVAGDITEPYLERRAGIREVWYLPYSQGVDGSRSWPSIQAAFVIRTSLPTDSILAGVKKAVWQVDGTLPVFDVETLEHRYDETLSQKRITTILLLCFSGFGFLMATLGIYGVTSYVVSRRTGEIGIRMALGAQAGDILKMVIYQGAKLVFAGIVSGLVGAFVLTRLMSSLLSATGPLDPAIFLGVAALLAGVAIAACFVPARRAAKVDPITALKYE